MELEELHTWRDDVHLPEDAGDYADDLLEIMNRIPIGWGRWISCDKGWYPLLTEVNNKMKFMYPDYEIHQVKEKYGTLRFYWGIPHNEDIDEHEEYRIAMVSGIMHDIAHQAEHRSAYICETCGGHGTTRIRHHWYKTLCATCAIDQGYPLEEWEEKKYASTD